MSANAKTIDQKRRVFFIDHHDSNCKCWPDHFEMSFKKRTKKFDITTLVSTSHDISGRIVFVCFLEEFKTQKRHFEINQPLTELHKEIYQLLPL